MDELARIKARINSLAELRELFSTMRAMAATQYQSAVAARLGIRRYAQVIERAIADAVALLSPLQASPEMTPSGRDLVVIIGSEHGFTGSYNRMLFERLTRIIDRKMSIGIVGRRTAAWASEYAVVPAWMLPMATSTASVLSAAQRLAARLEKASSVRLVYTRQRDTGSFDITVAQVLPIVPRLLQQNDHADTLPLHHLQPAALLEQLIGEYLLSELVRALMEALASENAMRLRVTEAADHNIESTLEQLTSKQRVLRQETITAEILDIVTGAEAVIGNAADDGDP